MSIASRIKSFLFQQREKDPGAAYDLWAAAYDNQPGNLMLDLDEGVFSELLNHTAVSGKIIADIGCGTGRHWNKLFAKQPARLTGYDVSIGMLAKLKEKYPAAETFLLKDELLPELPTASCDLVISTLAIAHIEKLQTTLQEWNRVLKPDGEIIITDYHPEALAKGGKRTFKLEGKIIAVKNYIHTIDQLRVLTRQLGWTELRFTERVIDDSVKGYYERQNALSLFESFRDIPIIYGIHLKKADDPA
jgi:ubiquinone/menaquinone biosynthesis C-methylase UbiE